MPRLGGHCRLPTHPCHAPGGEAAVTGGAGRRGRGAHARQVQQPEVAAGHAAPRRRPARRHCAAAGRCASAAAPVRGGGTGRVTARGAGPAGERAAGQGGPTWRPLPLPAALPSAACACPAGPAETRVRAVHTCQVPQHAAGNSSCGRHPCPTSAGTSPAACATGRTPNPCPAGASAPPTVRASAYPGPQWPSAA